MDIDFPPALFGPPIGKNLQEGNALLLRSTIGKAKVAFTMGSVGLEDRIIVSE